MIFTNKYNLPESVVAVLSKDGYKAGDDNFSATSLLKSPQQLQLYRRHADKLTEDVSDRVWSLLGQAAHSVLEQHGEDTSLVEERLYTTVLDRKLSGQVDHYHLGTVTDYKVTSVWTLIRGSKVDDWTRQLNIYAKIFNDNGFDVKKLQIVTILRDWSEMEKLRNKDYPEAPIMVIPITLWSNAEQDTYINSRVALHKAAESCLDEDLPPCTAEERWQSPDVYAVMKEGRKSAVKLYQNKEEADAHAEEDKKLSVILRAGSSRMCERYCPARDFCHQYKRTQSDDS